MWRSAETVALVLTAVILAYGIIAMALTIGLWALKELRSSRGQRKTRQRRP
jgi:multisubunit Na+/H+ antiporter MnhC subunit